MHFKKIVDKLKKIMYNKEKHKGGTKMYTRTFERNEYNMLTGNIDYEVININEYGFKWYLNHKLVKTGCVENIEEDIYSITDAGFEEVL